jgi:hypothetical protein
MQRGHGVLVRRMPRDQLSTGGAPELCGCSDSSDKQNFMRWARKRIPLACRQTGSNHAASVLACSSAVPRPCSARPFDPTPDDVTIERRIESNATGPWPL